MTQVAAPSQSEVARFIESNCQQCSIRNADKKKARCELWHGLSRKSVTTLNNRHLFWDDEGACRYRK